MRIKAVVDEDFSNYKKPSMFIGLGTCDWKCCHEANIPITVCQNSELAHSPEIEVSADEIFRRYSSNNLTESVVIGGLEPITRWNEVVELIDCFRKKGCNDDFVIYTGYYDGEIKPKINQLSHYGNIYMKTGRYVPNNQPHFDEVLGIYLISDNQKGVKIC